MNREQATWYHHEVADMLLVAGLAARANDCDFSDQYWRRLRAMLDYIASIMDVGGSVPNFGDADDAVIARLDPAADFDAYRSLLATGAVLFDSPELRYKACVLDDKTRWLLGDAAANRFQSLEERRVNLPVRRSFEEAGYFILGHEFETPGEVRIVADAGPLGFLSIAAHGHADALSFTLSAGGREILIDPGTYAYHTQRKWRDYFRGTSAHNTIRIDCQDQSVSGGNFLWRSHAQARVIEFSCEERRQRLVAEHNGYARLSDPVRHRRELCFESSSSTLQVIDDLFCRDAHEVELFWHFPDRCLVEQIDSGIVVRSGPVKLSMTLPPGMTVALERGCETPPLGWISRAFDVRLPAPTARASCAISGDARLITLVQIETHGS